VKRLLSLLVGGIALAIAAGATTLCQDVTSQNIASLKCTVGGLVFSNFQVVAAAGNAAPEVDLASADVSANGAVTLTFNPHMSAQPNGGYQDIYLYYDVTGGVTQVATSLSTQNAVIQQTACASSIASTGGMQGMCPTADRLANIIAVGNGNPVSSGTFNSAGYLSIFDSVSLSPAAVATLNSFSQVFNGAGSAVIPTGSNGGDYGGSSQGGGSAAGVTAVPEPLTGILMGSGLIALGFMRRKAHIG
jgi:hypothetical protein